MSETARPDPEHPEGRTEEPRPEVLEAAESLSDRTRRDFAVVVPAYDEAPVIPELIRELREAFRRYGLEGEVLLVDDGSEDRLRPLERKDRLDGERLDRLELGVGGLGRGVRGVAVAIAITVTIAGTITGARPVAIAITVTIAVTIPTANAAGET